MAILRVRAVVFVSRLLCLLIAVQWVGGGVRAADVFPACSWNCTANDVQMTSAYADLPVGFCEPGTLVSATINGVFSANATRYAIWVLGDIYVNGSYGGHIQQCIAGSVSPPGGTFAIATLTWPCGSELEIRNLVVSWSASAATCADAPTCTSRVAKCSAPSLGTLVVSTPLVVDFTSTSPRCLGTAISFTSVVTGGTAPYTYSWAFGDGTGTSTLATPSYTYAAPGTYTVTLTVSDNAGSVDSHSYNVTVYAPPATSATHVDVTCFGGATGSIDLTVSGGTLPYSYLWSNGATTQDLMGLAAGTYSVTVTDANGCTAMRSATITQPTAALGESLTHLDVACYGGSTGSIDLSVTGGTLPYVYLWSNGATTQDLSGIPAGSYSVTVTDTSGCTAAQSVVVTQPGAPLLITGLHVDVACHGAATGSIDVTVSGGTSPYSYLWSSGVTTQDLSNLAAESYSVTVTDAHGCTATWSANISQPAAPVAVAATHVDIYCSGGAAGSIDLTVTGGTPPYTVLWSTGATTQDLSGLSAGTYSATVTDAQGCTATKSVQITQPSSALALSDTHTNVGCHGAATGSIDLTATGGTSPYSYIWTSGATTQDLAGLAAGTYSVAVTDANGCTANRAVSIGQPNAALALTTAATDVACYGGSTGAVDLSVSGGTSPYSYAWSTGATTQDLSGMAEGTYSVTVTDAKGCTASTSAMVAQPSSPLVATVDPVPPLQVGDPLALAGGPGGMASYAWTGPNGFSSALQNPAVSASATLAMAGVYALTVANEAGCTAQASTEVSIASPPACDVVLSYAHTEVACFGEATGSIDLSVSGGMPPYAFSWSNGAATEDLTGLTAGTYIVTVTDSLNCSGQLAVVVSEPSARLAVYVAGTTDVACFGTATGILTASASGGTGPYVFSLDGMSFQSSGLFSGLPAGTYAVTVLDAAGCLDTASATIGQPSAPLDTSVSSKTDAACFGTATGSVTVSASGGTAPYVYSKDGGVTDQVSGAFAALAAGVYTITVTDANHCVVGRLVTIMQPAPVALSETHEDAVCWDSATGWIDLSVAGGAAPYTFSWSSGSANEDLTGIPADTYSVLVTDAHGCTATQTIEITQPAAPLSVGDSHVDVACFGGATGAIDLTVTGGTAPYTYVWSNGATLEDVADLSGGTYSVTVTDANGCTTTRAVTVAQPTLPLSATITPVASIAPGQPLALSGGPAGMASYSWTGPNGFASSAQDPVVSTSATPALAGIYTLTVTNSAGCQAQASVFVSPGAGFGGDCARGVIISEIAWGGTEADPQAEWIELQNLLDRDVDLSGWRLRWRLANPQTPGDTIWRTLPLSGRVGRAETHSPLGFRVDPSDSAGPWLDLRDQSRWGDRFLIERLSDDTVADVKADLIYDAVPLEERRLWLSNEGEIVELVDPTGCVVDTANRELEGVGGWLAGDEETGATMERTDAMRGDVASNWHTNLGIITYGVGRDGAALFGTAGTANQPLLETGIKGREFATLPLDSAGIATRLPPLGWINDGIPTRTAALADDNDKPVPATFSVDLQATHVLVTPTSILPPGNYDLWVRVGEVVLLFRAEVR